MKFIIALFIAFVAMASAFVPSASCRGVNTIARTRSSSTPLVSADSGELQKRPTAAARRR